MRSRIRLCRSCGRLSLRQECPQCGRPTENTFPPRYSPQDRYGKYRRLFYSEMAGDKDRE
ncbi:MAG: RNA-protein complex protein Nop10 [Thermoplasmatota archaeon]